MNLKSPKQFCLNCCSILIQIERFQQIDIDCKHSSKVDSNLQTCEAFFMSLETIVTLCQQ